MRHDIGQVAAASGAGQGLTPRELDVLRLMATGRSNAEIAEELFLSVTTVKAYAAALFDKGAGFEAHPAHWAQFVLVGEGASASLAILAVAQSQAARKASKAVAPVRSTPADAWQSRAFDAR